MKNALLFPLKSLGLAVTVVLMLSIQIAMFALGCAITVYLGMLVLDHFAR